ncbi:MAG TPA: NRDE family protein [Candidatus Eremiobacteraceae bacterium]|nr:NRDE family protein [Candidatus Eremiobacteraceae bacterium]
MCTLLIWKHQHPEYPIIVAANRDEFEGRPSTDPLRLCEHPLVVGGRDEVAGGTWLAVSELGVIVALTNRRGAGRHDPAKRSRGQLVLELSGLASAARIEERLRLVDTAEYNPFVFVALDRDRGIAAHAGDDGLRVASMPDGLHVVTNWEMDDDRHPKSRRTAQLASSVDIAVGEPELIDRLHRLLGDHAPGERGDDGGVCVHRPQERYGTRSSAIVTLAKGGPARFYYGRGHACENRMQDVSALFQREDTSRARVER